MVKREVKRNKEGEKKRANLHRETKRRKKVKMRAGT